MPSKRDIVNALSGWICHWGATSNPVGQQLIIAYCAGIPPQLSEADLRRNADLANFRLSSWHRQAADQLEAALRTAGVDPRPGDLVARTANAQAFPDVPPMQMIDLLTILADLRAFGPKPQFRPEQTFKAVFNFIRALSRTIPGGTGSSSSSSSGTRGAKAWTYSIVKQ
jgi:hypothetical protein